MDHSDEARNTDPISISAARVDLTDMVNRVAYRGERVSISRNGKVVAVLISPEDLQRLVGETEAA